MGVWRKAEALPHRMRPQPHTGGWWVVASCAVFWVGACGGGAGSRGPGGDGGVSTPPPRADAGQPAPGVDAGQPTARVDAGQPTPGVDAGEAMPGPDAGPLPGGGLAERYPGDVGIAGDPAVLFADDFESYGGADELHRTWNAGVYHHVRIANEPDNVWAGSKALEFRGPAQDRELSNAVSRVLAREQDVVYLRYHARFASTFDITGSSHNGSSISASYFRDGRATPGEPADGRNKFLVNFESWREARSDPNPGYLNLYVYHPEQRSQWGDHFFPTGTVLPFSSMPGDFGDDFVARPDVSVPLDRWHAYEIMVRANTPGARDGRITCWLDGEVIMDFPNLRLRDVASLKMDRVALEFHFRSNPDETFIYYDNVVAATEYIGPLFR